MSSFLLDYPFAERLYPWVMAVLERLARSWTDRDPVRRRCRLPAAQKSTHAGIADAVDGRVPIYLHKEQALDDVERRYPAEHYVLVDDKLRILTAVKKTWGERVTTVFVRQGSYAHDRLRSAPCRPPM